jgi:Protein of unknown function (DUF4239)
MTLTQNTPWWILIVVLTFLFAAGAVAGHIAVRRAFSKAEFVAHNEVAGFIIAVVGVLYAVMLAFLTVVVWEQFASAEGQARQEATAAEDLWRLAGGLSAHDRDRLTADIRQYTSAIIEDEWPKRVSTSTPVPSNPRELRTRPESF